MQTIVETKRQSSLVTQQAPDFTAEALMPNGSIQEINLYNLLEGNEAVYLFFYPLNFTFVCPTEIIAFNNAVEEMQERGVQVLGISVDSVHSHNAYTKLPLAQGGIGKLNFPLVSDLTKTIAQNYGVLINNSVALRGSFLIDKKKVVKHITINDLPLGRNAQEAIRVVDAMQHVEKYGEVCPANWSKGNKAMKPNLESVSEYLTSEEKVG